MDTSMGSMTTTKEWEWGPCEANSGIEDPLWGDAVAFLVDDEVQELYDDMREALNDVFDEAYPDPTPENEEEYFDRHAEWLDGFGRVVQPRREWNLIPGRKRAGWRLVRKSSVQPPLSVPSPSKSVTAALRTSPRAR